MRKRKNIPQSDDVKTCKNCEHNYPKDHILQGSNEALLAKSERYMMLYVFLKPEVSQLLDYIKKNDLWIWDKDYEAAYEFLGLSIEHFEFKYDIFKPDFRMIEAYRKRAYNYWNEVNEHRRIPLELFSKEQIIELKLFIPG